MKQLLMLLDDLLAPRGVKCLCCDARSEGEMLCPDCRTALHAMRLDPEEGNSGNIHCAYRYDGVAKQLVVSLKDQCVADAAIVLAEGMLDVVRRMQLPAETILTWVTMPNRRRKRRAIDHGYELCKALGDLCGLPVQQLLYRRGSPHTQRGLSRERRLRNLDGTFVCKEPLKGPVLLVDDVMTTGSTAAVCKEALMKAGACHVYVVTAAKANLAEAKSDLRKVDLNGLYAP